MNKIYLLLAAALLTGAAAAQSTTQDASENTTLKSTKGQSRSFGIKAGYNVARLRSTAPNFSPNAKNGFMVSAFLAPRSKGGLGYRSEVVFSRQGFSFDANGKQTSVSSDYIYIPQFTTLGITRFVQLQVGAQVGYLLRSSKEGANKKQDITSFTKRFDYGAAFGLEVYPQKNIIIGGRYNMSGGNVYEQPAPAASQIPIPNPLPFNPSDVKTKNAVISIYVGVRF